MTNPPLALQRTAWLRTAWLCVALLATTGSVAGASTINVQFYTDGVFYLDGTDPSTGTPSIGNPADSVGLSFTGVGSLGSPISVMSPDSPLLQNLGTFTATRGTNNNGNFDFDVDPGYLFQLSIYQIVPSTGTGTLVGVLSGQIKQDGVIDFTGDLSATIGNIIYTLTNLGPGDVISLTNPAQGFSTTALVQANITHIEPGTTGVGAVPEPASLTLLGLGLAGMAGRRWRQRKSS